MCRVYTYMTKVIETHEYAYKYEILDRVPFSLSICLLYPSVYNIISYAQRHIHSHTHTHTHSHTLGDYTSAARRMAAAALVVVVIAKRNIVWETISSSSRQSSLFNTLSYAWAPSLPSVHCWVMLISNRKPRQKQNVPHISFR